MTYDIYIYHIVSILPSPRLLIEQPPGSMGFFGQSRRQANRPNRQTLLPSPTAGALNAQRGFDGPRVLEVWRSQYGTRRWISPEMG
jgi:hypothetical protein